MLAMCDGAGPVKAMCLGSGKLKSKWTTERMSCDAFKINSCGAVDEPPDHGVSARAEYAKEPQPEEILE